MFIQVRLLNGFQDSLVYKVPDDWQVMPTCGTFVQVPLRNQTVSAIVTQIFTDKPHGISFTIKDALALEPFPNDPHYLTLTEQLAHYYQVEPLYFIKRIKQFLAQDETPAPHV